MKKRVIGVLIVGILTALIYQQAMEGLTPVEAAGMIQTQNGEEPLLSKQEESSVATPTAGEEKPEAELAETPTAEPEVESAAAPESEPTAESAAALETEPTAKPAAEPEVESAATPESEPTAESTAAPETEPAAASTAESEIEPAAGQAEEAEAEQESEYANLAIAQVDHYVNVRREPNTESEILGKIYNGAVAQILEVAGEEQDWFHVISGSVDGYIKAEFFLYGDAAVDAVDNYVTRYATVIADRLNVRQEQSTDSKRIGYIDRGEKVKILELLGDWLLVQYTDDRTGYVAAEYVTVSEEFIYAKSIEEERAEQAARQELAARMAAAEQHTPESTVVTPLTPPAATYTTNEELRRSIVDYAMQYLGYPYVHGGRSLATGTDCSGFTCYIYADFGYSLSRTPSGQYSSDGRSIDYSEIQPGDIICYGKSKCTHVGLYIGDGQIIHEANSRKGVVIYNAGYDTILGIKNIID